MDHKVLSGQDSKELLVDCLRTLKEDAISTNKEWAEKIGINPSVAITTIKPSGTVSQLVNSASGIHPRYSKYYIRTVRADVKDPLCQFLRDSGVPGEQDLFNTSNWVFSFPVRSPDGGVIRTDINAIDQLEHYLIYKKYWCEHNPSITVYVKEHEWMAVGAWVYQYLNDIGGVSFLPHSDHAYKQAPYQEIDEYTYHKLAAEFPEIDWKKFDAYEVDDATMNMHELSCVSGSCEYI